ncbi:hypothetical protein ABRP58_20560 [Pectobacterium aroidearum]|jgi:hypothetical protein|uniref:hypothetical protein n=1 Tax=Pectobacterium aroidearum TaxID=1201031 RepID=UPI002A834FA6|nr:hypothetical protein [Pectobacterium aroidearum]MDY4385974.1 hypothetical protein [Pectobacterium aroidearum]
MARSIGLIKWPVSKKLSVRLYLNFLLHVVEMMGLNFNDCPNDPVKLTRGYLDGSITDEERSLALSYWWGCISDDEIRNFNDKSVLMSRLAICFLSINEDNSNEISEHLSWFIEVLGFLNCNLSEVIRFMGEYFEFQSDC